MTPQLAKAVSRSEKLHLLRQIKQVLLNRFLGRQISIVYDTKTMVLDVLL